MERVGTWVPSDRCDSPSITVLYVDSDKGTTEEVETALERDNDGFDVLTATTCQRSLAIIADADPDAIVSSYELPDGSGIELLATVREDDADLPFVLFTGAGSEEVAADAISHGVTEYLQKESVDATYSELGACIRSAVESQRESDRAEYIREWYQTLIERSPGIIAVVNDDAEFVYRSPSTEHELGYSPESMLGETPFDYIHPDHHERVRRIFQSVMSDGRRISDSYQYKYEVAEGSWRWFESVIVDQSDSIIDGYIIYSRDITERKHRQQELDRERELFKRVLNTSPTGIVVFDTSETIRRVNERAMEILGISATEITNQSFEYSEWEFLDEAGEPIPRDELPFRQVIEDEESIYDFECRFVDAKGERRWLSINTVPMSASNGEFDHIISTLSDISQRKEHQSALEAEQAFTERALNTLEDLFFVMDTDGQLERINDRVLEVTGYSEDTVMSMRPRELFLPADRDTITGALDEVLAEGDTSVEARLLTTDGERRRYEFRAQRLVEEEGEVTGIVGIGRDITDRRLYEERLEVAQRVLRHNLRNDLNVIQGWTETLEETASAGQETAVREIMETTRELISLTEKSRKVTELDALFDEATSPTDVGREVRAVLAEFKDAYPDAEIHCDVPESMDVTLMTGARFEIALANAVENAIVHNASEKPWLKVVVAREGDDLTVAVHDEGPEIPAIERQVFTEGDEKPLRHGSGIGLWLINWCVTTTGGTVAVRNRDDGNVVEMRYPIPNRE